MLGLLMLKLGGLSPILLLLMSSIAYLIKPATAAGCAAKSCGRVTNISYPFWLRDPQQPPCGFPHTSFELSCEDGLPILVSSYNSSYYLRDIFYGNKSFWVRNKNFDHEGCAIPYYDIRADLPVLFRVSAVNTELRFFYNCSAPSSIHTTRIDCAPNATFALVGGRYGDNSTSPPNRCNTSRAPVLLWDGGRERSRGEDIKRLLKNGFLVEWGDVDACRECIISNGQCSPDDAYASFVCICPDGRHSPKNCSEFNHNTSPLVLFSNRLCQHCNHDLSSALTSLCDGYCVAGSSSKGNKRKAIDEETAALFGSATSDRLFWVNFRARSRVRRRTIRHPGLQVRGAAEGHGWLQFLQSTWRWWFRHRLQRHMHTSPDYCTLTLFPPSKGVLICRRFHGAGNLRDGRTVAIKRLYEHNCRRVEQFMTEVRILSSIRHPNLVILYGCTSRRSPQLLLVYEYVPNGTVADHLHGPRAGDAGLPWATRMSIAIETADALSYLHAVTPQIIHRDVKTNNILLDNSFHVKVADFGLSRLFPVNATHVSTAPQGTPGYVDPEYHRCYQLTDKSDVYSFGVVLVEIIASKPAVDISRRRHEINLADMAIAKIQNDELDQLVDPKLWCPSNCEMIRRVAEVAFSCLQADGHMRPTMKEVVEALRGIEDAKGVEADAMVKEDDCLLLKRPAYSPDAVILTWESRSATSFSDNNSQSK
ncbi:hypothetical protein BHE74_00000494 [Ensete ventricosum]|nr:hypothetical protein BHE74_00000494 [Ensete ventricosum]